MRTRPHVGLLSLAAALVASLAGAEETPPATEDRAHVPPAATDPFAEKPGYWHLFASGFVGSGLRFNNPYRLPTPLGSDAESVSRTAVYTDLGVGATIGRPRGLQHGIALRTSIALEGIQQSVIAPGYIAYRRWRALAAYGRVAIPIVLRPDPGVGAEVGVGGIWFFRAGLGVAGEIVGDLFYGAGTTEVARPAYPMLSGQLGLHVDYEVLP